MIRIKRNPRSEKIIDGLIIKKRRIRSEPPVFHELFSYDIYYQNEKIGYVWVNKTNNWVNKVEIIYPEYRRQGINSYVYDYIEKDLSIKLKPSGNLSSDGAAFWKNRLKKPNPTDYSFLRLLKIEKRKLEFSNDNIMFKYLVKLRGKTIAYAEIFENANYIEDVQIYDEKYRRKGLATYLYDYIEADLHRKLKPSPIQLEDGARFWENRNFTAQTKRLQ